MNDGDGVVWYGRRESAATAQWRPYDSLKASLFHPHDKPPYGILVTNLRHPYGILMTNYRHSYGRNQFCLCLNFTSLAWLEFRT